MTPRERIHAVLRHEVPDRVPRMVNFYSTRFDRFPDRLAEDLFDTEIRFASIGTPGPQREFMAYLRSLPAKSYIGTVNILRTYHDWGYHPEIPGSARLADAATVAEIAAAPLPDFMRQVHPDDLRRQVEAHHAAGYAVMASPPHLGGELFETAYRLRGFEQFMLDLIENPPLVDYLLEQLTAMHLPVSLALTRAGIDILALDEALQRLKDMDPELHELVELRFFGGLKHPAIARQLGTSLRTVERNWRLARAWRHGELGE